MEQESSINLVFLFFLISIIFLIPILTQVNILLVFLLFFLILIVFTTLIFPSGIWLYATIILFLGTLIPYNFHLIKYYPEHSGGAWPHPVISPTYLGVFFSLFLIFIFYNKKIKNTLYIELNPVLLSWLLFSIYSLIISVFSAYSLVASFYEFVRMIVALYIYLYVIFMIDSQQKVKKLFVILGIILTLESITSFFQYARILPLDLTVGETPLPTQIEHVAQIFRRVTGTFREPNIFAKFLSLYMPIFFVFSLINRGKMRKYSIFITIVSLMSLIMTLSRSAIIGTIIGLSFALFFINKYSSQSMPSKKILLTGVGIVTISVTTGIIFLAQILYLRFIAFGLLTSSERFAQYKNAIYIIKNHFFSGIGLNNYYFRMFFEDITGTATASPRFVVHNIYLLYFAETGLLGFLFFIFFKISVVYENLKTLTSKSLQPYSTAIIIGGISGFISVSLQGLLDWGFRGVNMYHLLFLLGLMYSVKHSSKESLYS